MTERPIMFSSPMVRAILDGRKTQTRRLLKGNVEHWQDIGLYVSEHKCPHGDPGDRLWLREALVFSAEDGIAYASDGTPIDRDKVPSDAKPFTKSFRPAMLMPRWASRITLEITEVRVQRLQEISVDDAIAEGVVEWGVREGKSKVFDGRARGVPYNVNAFAELWNSINAKRAPWASNPWVWAVTFKRVER